ncbi:MAG: hypothetical protein IH823_06025, partial [Candidatus Dadabacteria bacterium]|nr:hypothetical protein [Candidatus Dadabacteria bacterium]
MVYVPGFEFRFNPATVEARLDASRGTGFLRLNNPTISYDADWKTQHTLMNLGNQAPPREKFPLLYMGSSGIQFAQRFIQIHAAKGGPVSLNSSLYLVYSGTGDQEAITIPGLLGEDRMAFDRSNFDIPVGFYNVSTVYDTDIPLSEVLSVHIKTLEDWQDVWEPADHATLEEAVRNLISRANGVFKKRRDEIATLKRSATTS